MGRKMKMGWCVDGSSSFSSFLLLISLLLHIIIIIYPWPHAVPPDLSICDLQQ